MKIFEALHEGLRRAEAVVARGFELGRVEDWIRQAGDRLMRGDLGPVITFGAIVALTLIGVAVLPILVPFALLMTVAAGLLLFFRAWGREFLILMRLDDEAFPGRHDKLIWGLLMILIPPVGVWLFGTYREAHWGVDKVGEPAAEI